MCNRVKKLMNILNIQILLLIILLTASTPSLSQSFEAVKNPGIYVIHNASLKYSSLDPASNYESGGFGLNELICETLYDYDGNSLTNFVPQLASEDPVISDDGKQYNISLRQNVRFHDGTLFNAWIMKYSIDRLMIINDPNGASFLAEMISGAQEVQLIDDLNASDAYIYLSKNGVKVIDDFTIQFNLDYAYAGFIPVMTHRIGCAISPSFITGNIPSTFVSDDKNNETGMIDLAKWFSGVTNITTKLGLTIGHDLKNSGVIPSGVDLDGSDSKFSYYEGHASGTGPWKLTSFTTELIELNKNDEWWNKAAFSANSVDKILIKSVSDATIRALDLKEGEADETQIDPEFLTQFIVGEGDPTAILPEVKTYQSDSLALSLWGFNLRGIDELMTGSIEKHPSSDSKWDNQSALDASGIKAYEHLNKSANYTNPFTVLNFRKAFSFAFDYQSYIDVVANGFASRLEGLIPKGILGHQNNLISGGYLPTYDPDTAKALFKDLGWEGSITMGYYFGNIARKTKAQLFQRSISEMDVGIHINIVEMLNWGFNLKPLYNVPLILLRWIPDYADPDNIMTPLIHSQNIYYSNRIQYLNPELDGMIETAAGEINSTVRQKLYEDIEKYIAEENIFMYATQGVTVSTMHYWISGYESSGSTNPMRNFRRIQFMDKIAQNKPIIHSLEPHTDTACTCVTPTTNLTSVQSIDSTSKPTSKSFTSQSEGITGIIGLVIWSSAFFIVGALPAIIFKRD